MASGPYVGLRPFESEERDRFFGREQDASFLCDKILTARLTILYAQSGLGKSSLLKALVIPQLEESAAIVTYFDAWRQDEPTAALKQLLINQASQLGVPSPSAGSPSLVQLARLIDSVDQRSVVLVLDQFEELLISHGHRLDTFRKELAALVRAEDLDLQIVLSLREEFVAALEPFRQDILNLFHSTYRLEALDRASVRKAILEPAKKFGRPCEEDPDLVGAIVMDLERRQRERSADKQAPSGYVTVQSSESVELPILQLVCSELWNASEGQPHLTLARYNELGLAEGIIDRYVRSVMPSAGADETTARLLRFLAPNSGYKQSFSCDELCVHTELPPETVLSELRRLAAARILRTRSFRGDERFELQHDAFAEVLRPWRDAVLERLRTRERVENERRARRQRLKQRGTAAALAILCLLVAGAPTFFWLRDRQQFWLNTVGQLEPLKDLETDEAWQIGPTLERVVTYLLFQRQDDDRYERLKGLLVEYGDLQQKIPRYGVNYNGSQYLPIPDESWPLQLHYSTSRLNPDDRGEWEDGFRSEWHLYMQDFAGNWGVPVPQIVFLKKQQEFPRTKAMLTYPGHAPLELVLPDFRDTLPVLEPTFLQAPKQEQGREFFNRLSADWGKPIELELHNPVKYYRVPTWSIPVWNLLNGESQLHPGSSVAAATMAGHLLAAPDVLLTPSVIDIMLRRLGNSHLQAVTEARTVRGSRLRNDLSEIIRLGHPLTANHLKLVLAFLATVPDLDSITAASEATKYLALDISATDAPQRLSGPVRPTGGSSLRAGRIDPWYDEAYSWLPQVDPQIQLVLGRHLTETLTRTTDGRLRPGPDLLKAYESYRDEFFGRFGFDFPEWELQSDREMEGSAEVNARYRVLNQENTSDEVRPFEAPSIEHLLQALRFRAEKFRTYWISLDQSFNAESPDRNNASSLWHSASPLRTWLEHRYSKTDLVRIQRAVIAPTADERQRNEHDPIATPAYHTLRHLDWLLSSLAFWSEVVDPLDLKGVATALRDTQRARLSPNDFRSPGGEVARLVSSAITELALQRYDSAEKMFATAIALDRSNAIAAFLDQYPKQYSARRLAELGQGCDQRRLSQNTFDRPDHIDLVDLVASLPSHDGRLPYLRLCAAATAPSNRKWMADAELRQLLMERPDPQSWPAEQALWFGEALLSVDPIRQPDQWRARGVDFVRSGVTRLNERQLVVRSFERFLNRCESDGPHNWCWTLLRDMVSARPLDNLHFSLANRLSNNETSADLEDALKWIDTLRDSDLARLLRHIAQKNLASLGDAAMRSAAETGFRQMLLSRNVEVARHSRRNLVELLVDRGEFAEATRLADEGMRRLDTQNAGGYLIDLYYIALLGQGADAAATVLETMPGRVDNSEYALHLALHNTLTQSAQGEEYARRFLGMKHPYSDYVAMMLFSAMRMNVSGSLSPVQERAEELLAQRWAEIEPDRANWPARIRGGDVSAWREMLIGYYRSQVLPAEVLDPLENEAAFARSDLHFLPMPRQALMTEAYFYDAMLARSNGDMARMTQRLETIVHTGYSRYIEYKLAWFLLQQVRGAPVRPGS